MIFTILEMVFDAILTRNDILLLKFSFPTSLEVWETKLVKMVLSCHTLFWWKSKHHEQDWLTSFDQKQKALSPTVPPSICYMWFG